MLLFNSNMITMKSIITMIALLAIGSASFAQKSINVPDAVKTAFAKQSPGATDSKWEKEDGKYEVNFKNAGKETSALFSSSGNLEETEVFITESELPANALKIAKAKGIIKEASRITKTDGTVMYEAEVNKKDLLFDASGNPVKK